MASTSDLRTNAVIKYNGENHIVLEYQHIKPGKGGAYYQTKMRNMSTGKIAENRFRSGETIEFVRVENITYQYLYQDGDMFVFMNKADFSQINIPAEMVGDQKKFMKENEDVQLQFEGDIVLNVDIPQHVNLRVVHTEPGVRGDTATNVVKPATVESGAEINVPIFINEGDLIRVDTREGTYIERVKE